jgi:hypothetical protein
MRARWWLLAALCLGLVACEEGGMISLDDDDDASSDDDSTGDDDVSGDDDSADDDDATGDDDTTAPADGVYMWSPIQIEDALLGCESMGGGTVVNDSEDTVTVADVALTDGADVLEVVYSEPPPWTLEPGQTAGFGLVFRPAVVGEVEGAVVATTDHPDFLEVGAAVVTSGVADDDWMEAFVVEETALVDLLWVVDNSCSMEPEQTALAALGGQVIDFLTAEGVDYQLGVITTDNAHLQGPEPVMTPWTANVAEVFEATVRVGTAGSGTEQPLHQAWSALTAPLNEPGGPNDGFLRDAAALALIVVTDEDDQSTEPVDELAAIFAALKPDPAMVALNAVHPGEGGCTAPDGWIGPAPRLHETVAMMGGVEVPVCDEDWSAAWTGVPELLLGPLRVFELTFSPMPATLEITVDGVPLIDGWSYDEARNAIVFDAEAVPEVGTELLVYYVEPADDCS